MKNELKKIYIISGERSGDLHASNLVYAMNSLNSSIQFRGMGGEFSRLAGVDLKVDYSEVALMGFLEVVVGFRKVLKYLNLVKNDLLKFKPDALVLVDYGGFNMKIAAFAKENEIPVHYYIPPKVWAWNQSRAWGKGAGSSSNSRTCHSGCRRPKACISQSRHSGGCYLRWKILRRSGSRN